MKMSMFLRAMIAVAVIIVTPGVALAHHSHAMFDDTKEVTLKGTVKSFNFANPHVYLFVDVANSDGTVTDYPVEMSYTQAMLQQGIKADTFKEGDKVSVAINPLRDGRPGGSYTAAIDSQGVKHGRYPGGCQAGQTGCTVQR